MAIVNIKNTILHIIMNNTANIEFFKASKFHGDISYRVVKHNGVAYFQVKTNRGHSHYRLIGSTIGTWTPFEEIIK